jgi:endo-1,4-beta-mannosidase
MAAYVKSLDTNHLVTVGTEGFYGPGIAERLGVNPGEWAASLCSDFIQNSAVEHIDFASVHAYPDSWYVFLSRSFPGTYHAVIVMFIVFLLLSGYQGQAWKKKSDIFPIGLIHT